MVEISTICFKFKHLPLIIEMHELRQCPHASKLSMKTLPKIGYISLLGTQPVAAGFLRRVEGGYAMIDALVSNPYFGSQIRHLGLKQVVDSLIEEAKALKLEGIISYSADPGVIHRAQEVGFKQLSEEKLLVLPLNRAD